MAAEANWGHLLAGCDEAQRLAITIEAAPLIVRAGAGSGKTRVLTRRVAWRLATGTADPAHLLVATFTRKAAAELRDRLGALGVSDAVTAGTFHALALAELRRLARDRGEQPPVVLERRQRLLERVLPARAAALPARFSRNELVVTLLGEIDWAKARGVAPEAYAVGALGAKRQPALPLDLVAELYRAFELEKRRRRVLDFDDLLTTLTAEIHRDPDFAAAQQWRFRHFFLDELQDLTPVQLGLLEAWLGGREDLFAVGDSQQAIYGWNGALNGALLHLKARYPGATLLSLGANYRSSPQIVAFAAATFGAEADAAVPCGEDGLLPQITAYPSAEEEAAAVAASLLDARKRGHRYRDCAVLARTNAQLRLLEGALDAAQIPRRRSLSAFLSDPDVAAALRGLSALGTREQLVAATDALESGASRHLAGLALLARDYLRLDPLPSGEGLAAFVAQSRGLDTAPGDLEGVDVLTFHRAKGLEWPVVFVTGLEEGLVPIAHARDGAARDEERRLLYVALSRAARELHCSYAESRSFGERAMARNPSPYLAELRNALTGLTPVALADAASSAIATSRAHLSRVAPRRPRSTPRRPQH